MARRKPAPGLLQKRHLSTSIVVVLIAIIGFAGVYLAIRINAASGTLSLTPATATPSLGTTFKVTIHEDSGTDQVNAVQANITYPTSLLEITSSDIDFSSGAFATAAQADVAAGVIKIARGTSGGTSVSGDQIVAVLTFKTISKGTANLAFTTGSALVRSTDNINILAVKNGSTYNITDDTAPTVPTDITFPTTGLTSIGLSWAAATDNVGVTGYKIYRNGAQTGTSTTTKFTDSNLTPGTSYSYTVAAYDAAGNLSDQSAAATVSTLPDTDAPTSPTGLKVSSQTESSVGLQWTASTDNIGVTGYKIYRGGVEVGSSTSTSFTESSLSTGTFSYTVAAVDKAGNISAKSSAVSVILAKPGDANGDNKVNIFDLSILLSKFGTTYAACDFNHNGKVDIVDLSLLLSNYGK